MSSQSSQAAQPGGRRLANPGQTLAKRPRGWWRCKAACAGFSVNTSPHWRNMSSLRFAYSWKRGCASNACKWLIPRYRLSFINQSARLIHPDSYVSTLLGLWESKVWTGTLCHLERLNSLSSEKTQHRALFGMWCESICILGFSFGSLKLYIQQIYVRFLLFAKQRGWSSGNVIGVEARRPAFCQLFWLLHLERGMIILTSPNSLECWWGHSVIVLRKVLWNVKSSQQMSATAECQRNLVFWNPWAGEQDGRCLLLGFRSWAKLRVKDFPRQEIRWPCKD